MEHEHREVLKLYELKLIQITTKAGNLIREVIQNVSTARSTHVELGNFCVLKLPGAPNAFFSMDTPPTSYPTYGVLGDSLTAVADAAY